MRLSRTTAIIVLMASITACRDAVAPAPPVTYTLTSVGGRPLPTFSSPIPEAPTITAASLQLEGSGRATLIERRHEMSGGDLTYTSHYTYKITGEQIQFDYDPPCPANAICIGPPQGTITGDRISLVFYTALGGIVYDFQHFGAD